MTNKIRTVLYVGVTSNLYARVYEHKNNFYPNAFTAKYKCHYLVYYEQFSTIEEAIAREKAVKKWNRAWKDKLINNFNPKWEDLFSEDL